MKTIRSLALFAVAVALVACSTAKNETAQPAPASPEPSAADAGKVADALDAVADARSLFGTQRWLLRDLPGYAGPIPTETREPLLLEFKTLEGIDQLHGHAGCNSFSMALAINGLTLKPGPIRATKMACDHLGFETAYLGVLAKVDTVRSQNGELQLLQGEELVLRYAPAE